MERKDLITKHPGNYLIGIIRNPKKFNKRLVRCIKKDTNLIIINKPNKNYYDEKGLLLPQFWALPRTENASTFF